MQAIILAAGMGIRLGNLTTDLPKAMVSVAGKELILYVMDFLNNPAISEKIVVTGYNSDKLTAFLKTHAPEVKTVFNPHFQEGSIRTIEAAMPYIKTGALIMNVDHIYPKRMLFHILKAKPEISAVCDFDRKLGSDDMKIKINPKGQLTHIRKTLSEFDGGYIGMTVLSKNILATYSDAVSRTRQSEGDKTSVESVLGLLAKEGHPINICNTSGIGWFEIDTQNDLAHAEQYLMNNPESLL